MHVVPHLRFAPVNALVMAFVAAVAFAACSRGGPSTEAAVSPTVPEAPARPHEAAVVRKRGAKLEPYLQELFAHDPLGVWRLDGERPGVLGADHPARTFTKHESLVLAGADVGGPEVGLELWLADADGTVVRYLDAAGDPQLAIEAGPQLSIVVHGEVVPTPIVPDAARWQHVGVSWRARDGLLIVGLDGQEVLRQRLSSREPLPFDGSLELGPFQGSIDELAVFDAFTFPAHWLRRVDVATRGGSPTPLPETLPMHVQPQRTQAGKEMPAVAVSPDGRVVALWSWETSLVHLWDLDSRRLVRTFSATSQRLGSSPKIWRVLWTPDARVLAIHIREASANRVVLWDVVRGEELRSIEARGEAMAFSPDFRRFVTCHDSSPYGYVAWSADGRSLVANWHCGRFTMVDVASNQRLYETDGRDLARGEHGLLDAEDGHAVWKVKGDRPRSEEERIGLLVRPDLRFGAEPTVVERLVADGVELRSRDTGDVVGTRPGPDLLATGRRTMIQGPEGATLWESDGGRLGVLERSKDWEQSWGRLGGLAWSPDQTWVVAPGDPLWAPGVVLRIWTEASGWKMSTLEGPPQETTSTFRWSPDGRYLAIGQGAYYSLEAKRGVGIWDLESASYSDALSRRGGGTLDWSPDGLQLLAEDSTDPYHSQVAVHDVNSGEPLVVLEHSTLDPSHRRLWAFSPDGRFVAGPDDHNAPTIWSATTGARLRTLRRPREDNIGLGGLEWSPNGKLVAEYDYEADTTARIWDANSGRLVRSLKLPFGTDKGEVDSIWAMAWSPDSTAIAVTAAWDEGAGALLRVWEVGSGKRVFEAKGAGPLAWSPDGTRLAVGLGKEIQIWDVARRARVATLPEGRTRELGWSPDGKSLAASDGREVVVWDLDRLESPRRFMGRSPQWHPSGTRLAWLASPGVTVWSRATDQLVTLMAHREHWMVRTTEGYFDGREGLPVALVQGMDAYDIAQIAPKLNRPDHVLEALGAAPELTEFYRGLWQRRARRLGLDPKQDSADFSSAPRVRVSTLGEPDADGMLQLQVVARDPAGLASVQVYVDGVPTSTPVPADGDRYRAVHEVRLSAGTNLVEVTARNVDGIESLRAQTRVVVEGHRLPEPRLFYVGLGVSDYADPRIRLRYAHQDALDLERALSKLGGFAEVRTRTFVDAEVDEGAIVRARELLAEAREQDTVVLFVAGHGARDRDSKRTYYYLDHDAKFAELSKTAIAFAEIEALLYESKARHKLLLLDTCESGDDIDLDALTRPLPNVEEVRGRSIERGLVYTPGVAATPTVSLSLWRAAVAADRLINQDLARRSGAIVLASALGAEAALESRTWANGAFTEVLLRALGSAVADANGDGRVDVDELSRYVAAEVPTLTGGRQHPNVERDNPLQSFGFVLPAP